MIICHVIIPLMHLNSQITPYFAKGLSFLTLCWDHHRFHALARRAGVAKMTALKFLRTRCQQQQATQDVYPTGIPEGEGYHV